VRAIELGYSVYFIRLEDTIQRLTQSYREARFARKLRVYLKPKLLICDEVGYTKRDRLQSNLCYPGALAPPFRRAQNSHFQ